ncbi:esterase-like activity of phytase family protein [Novosphingobium aquimarinum]|uniref:esterase-like activity of phytase family protein n=1 Tax=Novosphingobium aquimarinum TaxID=2682494 RepID=UPI0018DDA314|nr:esterase-like activity of phytase family protein [Novosphingobium aquimarinum]
MSVQELGRTSMAQNQGSDAIPIGGISGIEYDPISDDYLVVTDGLEGPGAGRIGRLRLRREEDGGYRVRWLGSKALLPKDKGASPPVGEGASVLDAEALRLTKDGDVLWSSEGDPKNGSGPGLYRSSLEDGRTTPLPLPPQLERDPRAQRGPRDNRSFEGLWIDPQGNIWLGLEAPLIEDGPPPRPDKGAQTQIMRIAKDGTLVQQWRYPLAPITGQIPGRLADNGLSEILGLGDGRFLVLERSGAQQEDGRFLFTTRLFCAAPVPGTDRLEKWQLAQFGRGDGLERANFEGVTFGPATQDNGRSLVLAADNNFEPGMPTWFVILAVDE